MGRKDAYKMSSKPRGMALIINNRNFTCGMKERVGTDKDAENLFHLFNWLGMATIRKDNLTGKEMIKEFEVSVLSVPSCCTFCFLSRTCQVVTILPMTVLWWHCSHMVLVVVCTALMGT